MSCSTEIQAVTSFQNKHEMLFSFFRTIIVLGSHEDREDEHGSIARSFTRKLKVPEDDNLQIDKISSKFLGAGILVIEVPKKKTRLSAGDEIQMEVQFDNTGAGQAAGSNTKAPSPFEVLSEKLKDVE